MSVEAEAEAAESSVGSVHRAQLEAKLAANDALLAELQTDWEARLRQAEAERAEAAELLKRLGLEGLSPEEMQSTPSLRNLNEDPLMSGALVYFLRPGTTELGSAEGAAADGTAAAASGAAANGGMQRIELHGIGVSSRHCTITYTTVGGGGGVVGHLRAKLEEGRMLTAVEMEELEEASSKAVAKADAADAAAKAAKRVAALEADLNEARARGGKAAADAGAGKSKLCTVL